MFIFLILSFIVFLSMCLDMCVFIFGCAGSWLLCTGVSLVATGRGCPGAVVLGLLTAVASAAEHRL